MTPFVLNRGPGSRARPLPIIPAAPPNLVDHFKCSGCGEWIYADDVRDCPERLRLIKVLIGATGQVPRYACLHHMPTAKVRCDICESSR